MLQNARGPYDQEETASSKKKKNHRFSRPPSPVGDINSVYCKAAPGETERSYLVCKAPLSRLRSLRTEDTGRPRLAGPTSQAGSAGTPPPEKASGEPPTLPPSINEGAALNVPNAAERPARGGRTCRAHPGAPPSPPAPQTAAVLQMGSPRFMRPPGLIRAPRGRAGAALIKTPSVPDHPPPHPQPRLPAPRSGAKRTGWGEAPEEGWRGEEGKRAKERASRANS